jgi:hypothetical protein
LARIVRRTIKENEQEALMQAIESDSKMYSQFDKIVDYLSGLDPEEQEQIQDVVLGGEEIQGEYTEGKRTVYKDYEPDRGPVEISKSEFVKRKLMSVLPASIVGAIMGIAMAGGMSADDVLQMALGTAAVTGGLGAGLISTVGRETVEVPDEEENDMEEKPMAESYRRKKVIRLTESDLARIVMRVLNEQPITPKVDTPTDSRDEIIATKDAQIESLTNEINQIMKDLKMQRRENIDKKVVSAKQKIKKLINSTIEKIDKKIDNARIENKSNKLRKLEMEKEELKVKLSEIEKTGDVFSKEQKEKIVKSIVNIYGAILTSISAIFGINTIKHQYK